MTDSGHTNEKQIAARDEKFVILKAALAFLQAGAR